MGRKRNRRALREALESGRPVMARRGLWKADHLEGYVVAVDAEWALLHIVYDVGLNGWSAVRLDTIREVEPQGEGSFIARALDLAGERPQSCDLDTASVVDLLHSATRLFPLVTVFTERVDPTVCAIGRPIRIGSRSVTFLDVSSSATWSDETRSLRLDDITRIDVGARYEQVLHRLAGYPPIPS
ncbi:hypothetical protein BH10ACT1_BH10ACT1_14830 [soil metagenome]